MSGVEVLTFGCRLNAYESDAARAAQALADGLTDAVIVNTCAVTGEAVRQAKQAIRKVAAGSGRGSRLVVTGCAAEIDAGGLRLHARGGPGSGQRLQVGSRAPTP